MNSATHERPIRLTSNRVPLPARPPRASARSIVLAVVIAVGISAVAAILAMATTEHHRKAAVLHPAHVATSTSTAIDRSATELGESELMPT